MLDLAICAQKIFFFSKETTVLRRVIYREVNASLQKLIVAWLLLETFGRLFVPTSGRTPRKTCSIKWQLRLKCVQLTLTNEVFVSFCSARAPTSDFILIFMT